MKSAKFLLSFVFICVMLTSFCLADGINYVNIKPTHPDSAYLDEFVKGDGLNTDSFGSYGEREFQFTYESTAPGVFTVGCRQMLRGTEEYSYRIQVYENGEWKDVRLAAYKYGDDYKVYSPTTSSGGTTATVIFYPGKQYRIYVDDKNFTIHDEYVVHFYRDPTLNDSRLDNYQTDLSSATRTSKNVEKNNPSSLETGVRVAETEESGGSGQLLTYTGEKTTALPQDGEVNILEEAFTSLFLKIGDFFVKILSDVIGENVTIASLVYNRVATINPNFWSPVSDSNILGIKIKEIINGWYTFFRGIAIVFYIIALLAIGIHIIYNSTGAGVQKAKELLTEWVKGILVLFFMPIVMKYIFEINDALVALLAQDSGTNIRYGSSFNDGTNWSAEAIEFRSPLYVSKYTGSVSYGSDEANVNYIKKVGEYEKNFDIMRIMRAYAGVTHKLGYVFIWYVTIGQLVVFIVIYYKRFFMITFLIGVFPIICMFNAISLWQGGKGRQMETWLTEYLSNVFLQFIHAIIYTIITGVCFGIVKDAITGGNSSAVANWLIIIVSINFIPEGEKILKKIFSAISSGSTSGGVSDSSKGIRSAINNGRSHIRKIMGR